VRQAAKDSPIHRQRQQTLAQMLEAIPTACDRGTKCNAQGYKVSWNGYKLHLDTADCGVPIAALLSSASMHDSLAAIPLSLISAQRVTNLYDLMDAGALRGTAAAWATFPDRAQPRRARDRVCPAEAIATTSAPLPNEPMRSKMSSANT
jgi:hypothetical protein